MLLKFWSTTNLIYPSASENNRCRLLIEEIIVSGLILGGLYSLLSIGFSLIKGVAGILNLAHGALYLLSAYLIYSLLPLGLGPAIIISLVLIVLIGLVIYRLLIGPLREKELRAAVVTLALALVIQESIKLIFGPEIKSIPNLISGFSTVLGVRVVNQKLLALVVALAVTTALWFFIQRTKQGKAIRAMVQNMDVARLVGINIRKVLMISMAISVLLAGIAAVLFAPVYFISPTGWTILFRTFPVIILGGLGSIKGSFVAAFILAFSEKIVEFTIGGGYIVSIVTFAIMISVLFIKPTGLFGKTTQ